VTKAERCQRSGALSSWRSTIGPWPIEQARQGLIDKVKVTASRGRLHRLDILNILNILPKPQKIGPL